MSLQHVLLQSSYLFIWFFTNIWMPFSKIIRSSICNPTMLKAIPRSERITTNQNFKALYKIFHYKLRKQIFYGWLKNFHTIYRKWTSERRSVGFEILENWRWSIISWIFTIDELFRWLEFLIGKGRFKKKEGIFWNSLLRGYSWEFI